MTDTEQLRARCVAKIQQVVRANKGRKPVEIYLALGAACDVTSKWDRAVWIEEVHRIMGED
jgi:hypothetical protein